MVIIGLILTVCQIVGVWVVVKKVGGAVYNYISQCIGHYQHGFGKFEYISKKEHERSRQEHEENGDEWYGCCCEDCDENRFNSVHWLRKYHNLPFALKAFDNYHRGN